MRQVTAEDLTAIFIKNGWSENTLFEELTKEDLQKAGVGLLTLRMDQGERFFRMAVSNNIYDEKGKLIAYGNLKTTTSVVE